MLAGLLASLALAATAVLQAQAVLPANCDRSATRPLLWVTIAAASLPNTMCPHIYQLAAVNAGVIDTNCANLYAGEVVCLGIAGQDCMTTCVVQSGDTCIEIADMFNHDILETTLLTNNPESNQICMNLYPNEALCVSSTIYVNLTQS